MTPYLVRVDVHGHEGDETLVRVVSGRPCDDLPGYYDRRPILVVPDRTSAYLLESRVVPDLGGGPLMVYVASLRINRGGPAWVYE